MNKQQHLKVWAASATLALSLLIAPTAFGQVAPETLSFVPSGDTQFDVGSGGGSEMVTFEVTVSGLSASSSIVSAFDFGIVYDPAVMSLSSFSGFGSGLGSPALDSFEVLTQDHLDATNDSFNNPATPAMNSVWDYRNPSSHPGLGNYNGPQPGTPVITGPYALNEGSLRFTSLSLLTEGELQALQNPTVNDSLTLFSLTFIVDTTQKGATPLLFVDDRYYDGWPNQTGGLLDFKLNDGFTSTYLTLNGSGVSVPLPGTLLLMVPGLLLAFRSRVNKLPKGQQ